MYPSPTSATVCSLRLIAGMLIKNSKASSTVMDKMSEMFLPLYRTDSVSELYLFPLHSSQTTYTSDKNCISIFLTPSPSHAKHLPSGTLNENWPGVYPLSFDISVFEYSSRIGVNAPM